MDKVFKDASWIWYTETPEADTYGDFTDKFIYNGGKVICRISCDGDYTLKINSKYVSSNQYADYEHYKSYDEIDITEYLVVGENTFECLVWHYGIGSYRYLPAQAGLLYEILCDDNVIAKSNCETLSRENPNYKNRYLKLITPQLGQSFLYDASLSSNTSYSNSVTVNKKCNLIPRPIKKSVLLPKKEITILKNDGNHYLVDLGEETVGFPTLKLTSNTEQKLTIAWGEHIVDGGVRSLIGDRNFTFEYTTRIGLNDYTNYMIRLGCRYLEVFCENDIELDYVSLIPLVYPVDIIPKKFDNELDQKIYDVCVRTLKLCMMDRYVDTPWREQGFYVYDSRNQMHCGYHTLENKNKDYARAGLILISKGIREDGLLPITYPNGNDLPIPSFSLHYFTSVREYIEHTGDLTLAEDVYDVLLKIANKFVSHIKEDLMYYFDVPYYWYFYDWSPFMDGYGARNEEVPDLMMNCLLIIALENFKVISEKIGKPFVFQPIIDKLRKNTKLEFFCKENGLFTMHKGQDEFTELGNSVAIIAGLVTKEEGAVICDKMVNKEVHSCSLSMKCIKFDAMLSIDEKYCENIIAEIRETYKYMLDQGATSVWEVIEGDYAFGNAGSLCHGWSSVPVLYL